MNISTFLLMIVAVVVLAWIIWLAKASALLKDQLIPQIPAHRQTFSLARSQMAFWFLIVLLSFLYLFIKTGSTDVITSQALMLMGLSALTAGGGAVVDSMRDTPEDAMNDGLKALGLSSYQDVLSLEADIAALTAQGDALSVPGKAKLNDLVLLLQTYKNRTQPFETNGWFKDLTTDIDGTALHRLQAVVWTIVVGSIFIYQVCLTGAMPNLNENLLLLMGISNAGYVGFKSNETQY
ncbi:hypothetical protein [Paralcaligenes ureilyticus]|uniref:Uncharacterized protein n=1 Tax=Paralcaligenes ureilyticus TaxID=627131 RepID=A0A4R3LSI2_9BURK|nr:hypothetical protein [Paralcaligenes ureilyticus]TCT02776.1 hypothetical protein EDC26_11751 [Paralcaligenes ureilyticus]